MQVWQSDLYYLIKPVELHSGISDNQVSFFVMNDKCYILDGVNYLEFDGTTMKAVEPYIPTISISKEPAGGGSAHEDFNLLGAGFKDSFSTLGTDTVFHLSLKGLDTTVCKAEVNGVSMTENNGFTVDRVNGTVNFTTAPAKGTNNVIITAYKTQVGFPERIKKCRFQTMYGGSNDTRVFISGNPDMPDYVWRSGLYDPTYFPENGFYKFPEDVKGFSKQYDYLVVHRVNGKHLISYEIGADGLATFPSKPINDQIGTLASKSIQIIENNPVSLSKNGVYMLTASNVRDERNVTHLSAPIDAKLLREPNLDKAVSVEFDKKYWLAVDNNVYMYDYMVQEWFLYDNIHASNFLEYKGNLYFGDHQGLLYRFKRDDEPRAFHDDGKAINAYWTSKHFTFGADELRKFVEKVFYSIKPGSRTSVDLYYVTNKKESELVKSTRMDLFDFNDIDFNNFSFLTSIFPQETMAKIKAKKITHFQLILKNDKADESLGILSVGIKYKYQSYVK
ncbi:hypothetical protein D0469_06995 [Peribacillus saganii]|uniref:Uncharacterized protein n=1 Tax=Peribacillus saganii TaxID=2303992 RepID=A0A372LR94_9BACI|nr:hypothetical protein [Peribacillus saganii]RFU70340.1 hypothetical protein D0469_06995 [Peribacillus saganii]